MKILKFLFILCVFSVSTCMLTSCGDDGYVEYHHIFPRQYAEVFQEKGINVDDFTVALTKKDHRGKDVGIQYNPNNWNAEWEEFLTANPEASPQECYDKAQEMLQEAGFRGKLEFFNYQTKEESGASIAGNTAMVVTAAKGFWGFCGKLGNWLIRLFGSYSYGGVIIAFLASLGSTVLGWFGIKVGHPVAVGVGFIAFIFGIIALIGVGYCIYLFVNWLYLLLTGVGAVGVGVGAAANG